MLKSLDLFSGVGGITHALRGLATPVMYCEKDPECRQVMQKLMSQGKIPRARVHEDVAKLMPSEVGRVDLIAAGFPCIGFSTSGLRQGLDNPGSHLFVHIIRLAKALRPPLLFLENVDAILGNNDIVKIVKSIRGLGYDMWWVVVPAYSVGAPQKRKRWFCLAVRQGVRGLSINQADFTRFSWASEPAVRMVPPTSDGRRRVRMLGNSVVPDCVRAAFLSLFTGCKYPVPKLMRARGRLVLDPPKPLGPVLKSHTRAYACVTGNGAWQRIAKPPGLLPPPEASKVLDPKVYRAPAGHVSEQTSGLITKPRKFRLWATPRCGNGSYAMQVLTKRGKGDLGTQLRFERGTPARQRPGVTNPEFAEWLMGFPRGWTSL